MTERSPRTRRSKSPAPEEAKKRLLDAAQLLFSQHGLDRVSTRMLADAAKVNLFAIQYHFGGKDGLYLAAIRHAIRQVRGEALVEVAKIEEEMKKGELSKEACRTSLFDLLDIMIRSTRGSTEADRIGRLLLRQLLEGGEGFDLVYSDFVEPLTNCCFKLAGRILGLDAENPRTKLCVHAIFGQIFAFDVCRTSVVRSLNWKEYADTEIELIRETILGNAQAIFLASEAGALKNCRNA
jgi:TetR/AcrR family transcriptional regulator, regulator of cefoperazone and chloramphenicol sensitivity